MCHNTLFTAEIVLNLLGIVLLAGYLVISAVRLLLYASSRPSQDGGDERHGRDPHARKPFHHDLR